MLFEVGKRVVGKLPKERIPVVKKEEQRVMLQSLFLKTHQEALKHPKSKSGVEDLRKAEPG